MKLRKMLLALVLLSVATTLSAQTMTAAAMATKAKTVRSAANDLRHKKVQRTAATILKDKDVLDDICLTLSFHAPDVSDVSGHALG